MTNPAWTGASAADGSAHQPSRARLWRLVLGALGLFWVCVTLWLVGAFIP